MRTLLLILAREYRLRLQRPSFWIVTLLVPLVLAALYALPVIAAQREAEPTTVLVVDETGLFDGALVSTDEVHFHPMPSLDDARKKAGKEELVLYIPLRETTIPRDAFLYYRGGSPSPQVRNTVDGQLQSLLRNAILEDVYQVEPSAYHSVESTGIRLHARDAATGKESFAEVKGVVAMVLAVLMAAALLLFGVQVMRSIQEEKQNRVAEVLATTVRPLQLLVGKVAGVALVALTQVVLWVALTALALKGVQAAAPDLFAQARSEQTLRSVASRGAEATAQYNSTVQLVDETVQGLAAIDVPLTAAMFVLFFLLGYLLYGTLLAALATKLDSDADALQWSLLVMSPLLLAVVLVPLCSQQPDGGLSNWFSLVPFTAPVGFIAKLPYGIGVGQTLLSIALLLLCSCGGAWLAARSYRRHLVG